MDREQALAQRQPLVAEDESFLNETEPSLDPGTPDSLDEHTASSWSYGSTVLAKTRARCLQFLSAVWNGPTTPVDNPPLFFRRFAARLEQLPYDFASRVPRAYRVAVLLLYYVLWFCLCYTILVPYYLVPPSSSGDPASRAISLSCLDQIAWRGKNGACGFEGSLCARVPPGGDVVFRCPALCDRSWTYSLIPIGDQRIKYRSYVIGGGSPKKSLSTPESHALSLPYRADSFACGAAVHAGVVSPLFGGCARISHNSGPRMSFNSAKGHYHSGPSIEFDSFFRSSFYFTSLGKQYIQCTDPRLLVLAINVLLGAPIVYFASGAVAYWTIGIVGFWTVSLATDPPRTTNATSPDDVAAMLSICFERFMPSCFILYVLWHVSAKRTLSANWSPDGQASERTESSEQTEQTEQPAQDRYTTHSLHQQSPLGKLLLWYPLFWLGVLNNITFDRLPVDRLTLNDLKEQPGAMISVLSIFSVIITCAFIQGYKIWLSGRFRKYLIIYTIFLSSLFLLAELPGLTLRVHHYILAMLLIPGCSTRGPTALLFQGILLGLFLSGSARWGLASIVETASALRRNDPKGIVFPPSILGYNADSGLLTWEAVVEATLNSFEKEFYKKYSAISLLVNDIEYYMEDRVNSLNLKNLLESTSELSSFIKEALSTRDSIPIYLRLGRKIPGTSQYGDFTNAAVLQWPSGELKLPLQGLT